MHVMVETWNRIYCTAEKSILEPEFSENIETFLTSISEQNLHWNTLEIET